MAYELFQHVSGAIESGALHVHPNALRIREVLVRFVLDNPDNSHAKRLLNKLDAGIIHANLRRKKIRFVTPCLKLT